MKKIFLVVIAVLVVVVSSICLLCACDKSVDDRVKDTVDELDKILYSCVVQ